MKQVCVCFLKQAFYFSGSFYLIHSRNKLVISSSQACIDLVRIGSCYSMCGMCLFWLALAGFECLLENLIFKSGKCPKGMSLLWLPLAANYLPFRLCYSICGICLFWLALAGFGCSLEDLIFKSGICPKGTSLLWPPLAANCLPFNLCYSMSGMHLFWLALAKFGRLLENLNFKSRKYQRLVQIHNKNEVEKKKKMRKIHGLGYARQVICTSLVEVCSRPSPKVNHDLAK